MFREKGIPVFINYESFHYRDPPIRRNERENEKREEQKKRVWRMLAMFRNNFPFGNEKVKRNNAKGAAVLYVQIFEFAAARALDISPENLKKSAFASPWQTLSEFARIITDFGSLARSARLSVLLFRFRERLFRAEDVTVTFATVRELFVNFGL